VCQYVILLILRKVNISMLLKSMALQHETSLLSEMKTCVNIILFLFPIMMYRRHKINAIFLEIMSTSLY
jgi:hypothetical protein